MGGFSTSHVHSVTARTVVSESQVPPIVLVDHVPASGASHTPNYGHSHGTSHGTPYGSSHGHLYGPHYGQNYQPYGYGYQQPAYSSNYGFVAPHNQGPHIIMLPCNPTWVKWEEVIMAKAMVFIEINLT